MTGFYKDYADASDTHQNSAEASATAAEQSATQAATSASEAATSASEAATSASQAAASVSSIDLSNYAELSGADFTGNVSLNDNGKALFGNNNDLEIYHDGSNSYIHDTGTGGLYIRGSDEIALRSSSNENIFLGLTDGSAYVYHDGSVKLQTTSSGIDVTGRVTADNLTVDGGGVFQGTSTQIDLIETDVTGNNTRLRQTVGDFFIQTVDNSSANPVSRFNLDHATGDISFYEDTGTTPKFFWDASAESLTVGGTGDDGYNLNVESAADTSLSVFSSNNPSRAVISTHSGNEMRLESRGGGSASMLTMYTGAIGSPTERLRIDSSGNVGIGTTSPDSLLEVVGADPILTVRDTSTGFADSHATLRLAESGSGDTLNQYYDVALNEGQLTISDHTSERMRINSSGNVGIGTTSPDTLLNLAGDETAVIRLENTNGSASDGDVIGALQFYKADGSGAGAGVVGQIKMLAQGVGSGGHLTLSTGDSNGNDVERLRVSSNGNVGIGTTNPNDKFHVANGSTGAGYLRIANNEGYARLGTDGGNLLLDVGGSEKARIDSSGNVGIGTTSPARELSIGDGTGSPNIQLLASSSGNSRIEFGDADDSDAGEIQYEHSSNYMQFTTNGSEKARIDSSGRLLVGKTSSSIAVAGHIIESIGRTWSSVDGGYVAGFNRLTSDGSIVQFRKDGTTVGSIGVYTAPFGTTSELTITPETGVLKIDHDDTFAGIKFADSTTSDGLIGYTPRIGAEGNDLFLKTGLGIGLNRLRIEQNGDISFYEDTGTTPKLFWDASEESLGIGTTTPATELDVNGTITANAISLGDSESIAVGADDDLTITHDGTDTTIQNDTGDLIIDVNDSAGTLEIQHEGVRAVTITDSEVAFYMGSSSFPMFSLSTANGPTFYSDITMSGTNTVDGRDISVDGAKLDKIPEKTIRTRFQKRGQSNTVGFLTLTNTLQNVGTVFRLNASVTTAVEHILDLNISANFLDINSTNDGEFIVAVTAPAPANETTVNLGTVISTSFTGSTFQFVLSGDLTKHFSPYCGMSVNSDGSSAFGFNTYDGWSYDPFYNRTTVECYLYQANKPTTGDTVYLHPFDWETSGTVLNGDTYPIEAYNALGTTNQNQFHQIYLGYYKDNKNFQIKAREVTTQENIQISRISGTYSNIIGI